MELTFSASPVEGSKTVNLAQVNEVVGQAVREAIDRGTDPASVELKVRATFGARLSRVEIALP